MTRLYLYGFAGGPPGDLRCGMADRPVFALPHQGIALLVSPWDNGLPLPQGERGIVAHERVVEAAMEAVPILPCCFGTVVDESVAREFVDRHAGCIRERLDRVAGHVEVSLKIIEPATVELPSPEPRARSGTAYMLRQYAAARRQELRQGRAQALVDQVERELAPWVRERHHRIVPTPMVLATVTHLIDRACLQSWSEAVADLQTRLDGLDLLASGPWPPYHFAEVTGDDRGTTEPAVGSARQP